MKHVLLSLLFVGSSCLTTLRGEETNDPASDSAAQTNQFQTDPFVTSGKTEGAAAAYQYVFGNPEASDTDDQITAETATKAFLVPKDYNLVTVNDDNQTVCYGDAIRLWHNPTGCYLHKLNYAIVQTENYTPENNIGKLSGQTLAALETGADRSDLDKISCWLVVKGPDGSNDTELMGKPINLSQPFRLFALLATATQAQNTVEPKEYTLHSHSYQKYKHPSPVREKDFEDKQGIKQEVTWCSTRDQNDNWELASSDEQPLTDCKLGSNLRLRHTESQKYLRGASNIAFPISRLRPSPKKYEVSAVSDMDGENSIFKIALIARPLSGSSSTNDSLDESEDQPQDEAKPEMQADTPTPTEQPTDKEWLKTYLSQFDAKKRYKIVTDQYYDGDAQKDFPEEYPMRGFPAIGGSIGSLNIKTASRSPGFTGFHIRVDTTGGYLGIQLVKQGNGAGLYTLQHKRNKKTWNWGKAKWKSGTWTHNVSFNNNNFKEYEKWRPIKVDDEGWIYLQNKASKWFMSTLRHIHWGITYRNGQRIRTEYSTYSIGTDQKKKIRIKIVEIQ